MYGVGGEAFRWAPQLLTGLLVAMYTEQRNAKLLHHSIDLILEDADLSVGRNFTSGFGAPTCSDR